MNEPKRYTGVIQELNPPGSINITTTEIFRADDPAIVSALKDSEALRKLERLADLHSIVSLVHLDNGQFQLTGVIDMAQTFETRSSSLISAIEQVKE